MPTTKDDLTSLFSSALAAGTITGGTSALLTGNLGPIVIAGAAGVAMENIVASDVTLVTLLVDASSSIASRGLEDAIRDGENIAIDAFATSKEKDAILVSLWTFNTDVNVIHSYVAVDDATRLDRSNYAGVGATRLYDTWCDALAANVAYAQRLREGGTPCRSIVVVITDGEDVGSRRRAADCAKISRDLVASEQFVLAFVGVGGEVNFPAVARSMGIPEGGIKVQKDATGPMMRELFQLVSQSAIAVSRGTISPGRSAGFFSP